MPVARLFLTVAAWIALAAAAETGLSKTLFGGRPDDFNTQLEALKQVMKMIHDQDTQRTQQLEKQVKSLQEQLDETKQKLDSLSKGTAVKKKAETIESSKEVKGSKTTSKSKDTPEKKAEKKVEKSTPVQPDAQPVHMAEKADSRVFSQNSLEREDAAVQELIQEGFAEEEEAEKDEVLEEKPAATKKGSKARDTGKKNSEQSPLIESAIGRLSADLSS